MDGSRNPKFGLRSSNAIGPKRHVIVEGYNVCDSEMKFLSNVYSNPNTNSKTLTVGILTLNDRHDAFEGFCASVFCDFIRNYFFRTPKLSDT